MKRILLPLLIVILLAACGPASLPETEAPTSPPTNTSIPVATIQVSAAPLESLPELNVDHIDPTRVIPAVLDPNTNFDQVLTQYKNVMNENSQPMTWFSGTTNGAFDFQLNLYLTPAGMMGQTVTLQSPMHVTIAPTEITAEFTKLITPAFGGGGGLTNTFPSFNLQPGVIELSPSDVYGTEFTPGGASGILYDIRSACVQSGIYNVVFQIPYDVTTSGVTQSKALSYSMILACPQEEMVWIFDPDKDRIYDKQDLIFKNGAYAPKQ